MWGIGSLKPTSLEVGVMVVGKDLTMRHYFAMEAQGQARHTLGNRGEAIFDEKAKNATADKQKY